MLRCFYLLAFCVFTLGFSAGFSGQALSSDSASNGASDAAAAEKKADKFEYKKPMPKIKLLPDDEFIEKTTAYDIKPVKDEALEYTVRLPKAWKKAEGESTGMDLLLSNKMFGNVSRFVSPANFDSPFPSQFTIQVIGLEYELSAEQWFVQYLLSNGYALQGLSVHDEDRAEAMYVTVERNISYAVRSVAIRNGKRIILGRYKMPIERWENEKSFQAQAITSFKLANTQDELVEKMKDYHFLDIAKVQYPESWTLRAPPFRSIDRLDIELLSIRHVPEELRKRGDTVLNGKVGLSLISEISSDSVDDEINKLKEGLEGTGLVFEAPLVVKQNFSTNPLFTDVQTQAYRVVGEETTLVDYEYWITAMKYNEYYYFVTLLTPARKDDYYVWSRNTQTYRLIVEHFTPQEGSLTSD